MSFGSFIASFEHTQKTENVRKCHFKKFTVLYHVNFFPTLGSSMKHDFEIYGQLWPYKTNSEVPVMLLRAGRKYSEIAVSRTPYRDYRCI